jgi:hypothetical protein
VVASRYVLIFDEALRCVQSPHGSAGAECVQDPHLYFDANDHLHLLFHAFGNEPAIVNASCHGTLTSAHAYSRDGHSWFVSPGQPFPASITTPTKDQLWFWSRERPKVLWNSDGKMTHLVTAVAPQPRIGDDATSRYSACPLGTPCSNCKGNVFTETLISEFDLG